MSETCENLLSFVNSYVYYDRQSRAIYQVRPYSVYFKASGKLCNPLIKTVLGQWCMVNIVTVYETRQIIRSHDMDLAITEYSSITVWAPKMTCWCMSASLNWIYNRFM